MASSRDDFVIAIRSAFLKKETKQKFSLISLLAVSILIIFLSSFNFKTIVLLLLAIWGFCRAYYFAFYVIQHYVDPNYKFSGLINFAKYSLKKGRSNLKKRS